MKANQKFLNNDDDAVSPVIAVILMVAITVVLAATVYVWVSGFGSQSSQPAKSVALTSSGVLSNGWKNYTIASATSGMKYSDLTFTVNGATKTQDTTFTTCTVLAAASNFGACQGGSPVTNSATVVGAGDQISLKGLTSGDTLRILDAQANSVMLTLTIG